MNYYLLLKAIMDSLVPSLPLQLASWTTKDLWNTIHVELLNAPKMSVTSVTALKNADIPTFHTKVLENSYWTLHYQDRQGSSWSISLSWKKGRKYTSPLPRLLGFQEKEEIPKCSYKHYDI